MFDDDNESRINHDWIRTQDRLMIGLLYSILGREADNGVSTKVEAGSRARFQGPQEGYSRTFPFLSF